MNRAITIEPVRADLLDVALDHIRALLLEVEAMGGRAVSHEPEGWQNLRRILEDNLDKPDQLLAIALLDGNPVAYLEARIKRDLGIFEPCQYVHISVVRVAPEHRRQGIARALVDHALGWGREKGCNKASLHVVPSNPARHLYDALGFETTDLTMTMALT